MNEQDPAGPIPPRPVSPPEFISSSVPPHGGEPPYGGEPPAAASGLPWENRAQIGFLPALMQSLQMFAGRPREAFDSARRKGDYASPVIWLLIIGVVAGLIQWLYSMMFLGPTLAMMPPEVRDQLGPLIGTGAMAGGVLNLVYYPVGAVIGGFIWTAILHVCFLVAGGSSQSESGFEGTFRATAYSQVAQLAQIVPIVGGLIAMVWGVVLLVIGISSMHRISTGKSVIVVLIPLFLCCACISIAVALGAASLLGMAAR